MLLFYYQFKYKCTDYAGQTKNNKRRYGVPVNSKRNSRKKTRQIYGAHSGYPLKRRNNKTCCTLFTFDCPPHNAYHGNYCRRYQKYAHITSLL